MKKSIYLALFIGFVSLGFTNLKFEKNKISSTIKELKWETNYEDAIKLAKKKKRPLLVFFTGSDWCGPCKILEKDLFENEVFIDFSNKELILYKADFPKIKEIPVEMKVKNEELKNLFQVRGFPTVVLLDTNNEVLGKEIGTNRTENYDRYMKMINEAIQKMP